MAIKVRDYEVRLTRNKEERRQVRQLRYSVFVEEEGAGVTEEQKNLKEEYDSFDRFAEYMAVFHNGKIVGTYRIIDRDAAEKMGVSAQRCLVVEDSVSGVVAGKAAGMTVFGFLGGSHSTPERGIHLKENGADLLFDDFCRLPMLLENQPSSR